MGLRARHYRGYGPTVARRGLGSWKCALLTRGMRLVGSTMRLAALARTSGPAERDISHRHRQQMTPVSVAGRPHRSHFVAIAWRAAIRAAVRGRTGLGGDYTFDGRGKRGERRWGSVRFTRVIEWSWLGVQLWWSVCFCVRAGFNAKRAAASCRSSEGLVDQHRGKYLYGSASWSSIPEKSHLVLPPRNAQRLLLLPRLPRARLQTRHDGHDVTAEDRRNLAPRPTLRPGLARRDSPTDTRPAGTCATTQRGSRGGHAASPVSMISDSSLWFLHPRRALRLRLPADSLITELFGARCRAAAFHGMGPRHALVDPGISSRANTITTRAEGVASRASCGRAPAPLSFLL